VKEAFDCRILPVRTIAKIGGRRMRRGPGWAAAAAVLLLAAVTDQVAVEGALYDPTSPVDPSDDGKAPFPRT